MRYLFTGPFVFKPLRRINSSREISAIVTCSLPHVLRMRVLARDEMKP